MLTGCRRAFLAGSAALVRAGRRWRDASAKRTLGAAGVIGVDASGAVSGFGEGARRGAVVAGQGSQALRRLEDAPIRFVESRRLVVAAAALAAELDHRVDDGPWGAAMQPLRTRPVTATVVPSPSSAAPASAR